MYHRAFFVLVIVSLVLSPILPALAQEASSVAEDFPVAEEAVLPVLSPIQESEKNVSSSVPEAIPAHTSVVSSTSVVESLPAQSNPVSPSSSTVVESESPSPFALAPTVPSSPSKNIFSYSRLMHYVSESQKENGNFSKKQVASDIAEFVEAEKQKLDNAGIDAKKQKKYFQRLHAQARGLDESQSTVFEKIKDFLQEVLPFKKNDDRQVPGESAPASEKIPVAPPSFHFQDDVIPVIPLQNPTLHPTLGQKVEHNVKQFLTVPVANAMDNQFFPVLQDIQASVEAPLTASLKEVAVSLHNNPVEIMNYVKNTITYEPYFGLKKGAAGCLQQKVCNDVDSAALAVSLFRSAGIPARFKKSLAIFSVTDLKNLLGVEDVKSVYAAFALNRVPIFTVTVPLPVGANLDAVDLSAETHLAVQWVVPEVFYDYDERGGNIDNDLLWENTTSTEHLRSTLAEFPKKQWVPIDVVVRPYIHEKRDILSDRYNINTQNFWNSYLTYQGNLTPLDKYRADIQVASARVATSSLSLIIPQERKFSVLPLSLPFIFASGVGGGNPINEEVWSSLPDAYVAHMRLSLLTSGGQVVLDSNFLASEVDNQEISLAYDGATNADKALLTQYGGISVTPAELIDIVPYFQQKNGRIYNNTAVAVNVGDTLTLRFEMTVGAQSIQRDEKFSIAGNSEGIYIIFSGLEQRPEYDTNSKVLAGGNAALAYKYLEHVESERKFLQNFYDFFSNMHFARAVVTENRILNRVNNTPTTFEFKGLTLDAGVYLAADVSRRGSYTTHRMDTRFLFGLDASFYEGKLFEDVAGLAGISTIKGLQYAAGNPATYTISRITLANEATIDALPFSASTKQNMHTAVRSGNTIITPTRSVQMGSWQGILYINISPSGTGQYAIGEQTVQNGGWTVATVLRRIYQDASARERQGFLANFGTSNFYYEENDSYDTVLCRITNAEYNLIVSRPDWRAEYGYPCFLENKLFGTTQHSSIVTSNGAYFFSPGQYDYWVSRDNVKGVLLSDKNGEVSERLQNVRLDGEFKFNPIAGTYSWFGHFDGPPEDFNIFARCQNCITAYYQPTPNRIGEGRMVYGSILKKLEEPHYNVGGVTFCSLYDQYCEKKNWVLNTLGFPLMGRSSAAQSMAESTGDYQAFIGGHVYRKNYFGMSKSFYIPQVILQKFNSDEFLRNGSRGTGGKLGFPLDDPYFDKSANTLVQKFEWKMISLRDNQYTVFSYDNKERRLNNREYAKVILKKVISGEISDAEAFAKISEYLAYTSENDEQFVRDLTLLLVGVEKIVSIVDYEKVKSEMYALQQNEFQWGNYSPTGELFSDTGFKFKYNDSHYIQNCRSNGKHTYSSNQLYHSMLGFNTGFFWGAAGADAMTYLHDFKINPLGVGASIEDKNLGYKMREAGVGLLLNSLQRENMGRWIRENIMNERESPPRSKIILEHECNIRKNFRKFESNLGNEFGLWIYNQDMKNENGIYSQNYQKYGDRFNIKAIWDSNREQVYIQN